MASFPWLTEPRIYIPRVESGIAKERVQAALSALAIAEAATLHACFIDDQGNVIHHRGERFQGCIESVVHDANIGTMLNVTIPGAEAFGFGLSHYVLQHLDETLDLSTLKPDPRSTHKARLATRRAIAFFRFHLERSYSRLIASDGPAHIAEGERLIAEQTTLLCALSPVEQDPIVFNPTPWSPAEVVYRPTPDERYTKAAIDLGGGTIPTALKIYFNETRMVVATYQRAMRAMNTIERFRAIQDATPNEENTSDQP